jgi:phage terminase small subunit
MAGVKGRSGGKRTGAGRKAEYKPLEDVPARPERVTSPNDVQVAKVAARVAKSIAKAEAAKVAAPAEPETPHPAFDSQQFSDPKDFLAWVMNNPTADGKVRVSAAVALMPYTHKKVGEQGKKEERQEAASKVASKFARREPPRVVASNGKAVG